VLRILITLIIAVTLSGCFRPRVQDYRGDGTIQDTSDNGGFLPVRSYMITLPSFPLDKPYDHTFRLDHIPTILHAEIEICFFVPNSFSQTRSANADSVITYSLETADGTQITSVKSPLGKLIWSSPAVPIHYDGYALYELDRSFFHAHSGQHYRLHVTYDPAPGADAADGHFYLWSGVGGS
jgi:hypothetical protein